MTLLAKEFDGVLWVLASSATEEITRLREELAALREAAQAVITRWDTPLWKDVPATAIYIDALRAALQEDEINA